MGEYVEGGRGRVGEGDGGCLSVSHIYISTRSMKDLKAML